MDIEKGGSKPNEEERAELKMRERKEELFWKNADELIAFLRVKKEESSQYTTLPKFVLRRSLGMILEPCYNNLFSFLALQGRRHKNAAYYKKTRGDKL